MSFDWSFSTDRAFRRCQREAYYRQIAASHNSLDRTRREAYLVKQVKSPEMWRGNLVHAAIETGVVPRWIARQSVPWDEVIRETQALAKRQYTFSARRAYRTPRLSKTAAGDDFCALTCHEPGATVVNDELAVACSEVEHALRNLSSMSELLAEIEGRPRYWPEVTLNTQLEGVHIQARLDLLYFRGFGRPTIIDWKTRRAQTTGNAGMQTAFYGWLLHQDTHWSQPEPEAIELLEVDLSSALVQRHRFDAERFAEVEDHAYRSITEMLAVYGAEDFDQLDVSELRYANNPNSCRFCVFARICREACDGLSAQPIRTQESFDFAS
jgi:PD-(D/E)XK nuclease superfamily protein